MRAISVAAISRRDAASPRGRAVAMAGDGAGCTSTEYSRRLSAEIPRHEATTASVMDGSMMGDEVSMRSIVPDADR